MATKLKRARFDPDIERQKFQRRRQLVNIIQAKVRELRDAIGMVIATDEFAHVANSCDALSRELMLVTLLSLEGVDCLRMALQLIPDGVLNEKTTYVRNIVSSAVPSVSQLSALHFHVLSDTLQQCNFWQHPVSASAYWPCLRLLSETTGKPHTAFLAPPVAHCINHECNLFETADSLERHHPPTTVTLFTFDGPVPATKVGLRCKSCSTIYNYSMYGKKNAEGERYYDTPREFVEMSDAAYCDTMLHSLYCSLRYVDIMGVDLPVYIAGRWVMCIYLQTPMHVSVSLVA